MSDIATISTEELATLVTPLGITLSSFSFDCGGTVTAKGPGVSYLSNDRGTAECDEWPITPAGRLYEKLIKSGVLPDPATA